jgi:nucleoside phosphorylase
MERSYLIVTALNEEYDAALAAGLNGWADHAGVARWDEVDSDPRHRYVIGEYAAANGGHLSIAVAYSRRMGSNTTAALAAALVERLKPACLAMCGVCAGNRSRVALGDVIIAEIAYAYDEGRRLPDGTFEGDHRHIPMTAAWQVAAQRLVPGVFGADFKIVVGPMASGNALVKDGVTFDDLKKSVRSIAGLEMESGAVATVAHDQGLQWAVVKGVMDHADEHKDDRFKEAAAAPRPTCCSPSCSPRCRRLRIGESHGSHRPTSSEASPKTPTIRTWNGSS